MTRLRSRPQQQSQQCCRCCEQTMPSTAFLKLSISACRSFEPVLLVHGFRAKKIDAIPYINTFNRSRTDLTREWHCRTDKNCTHASRGRRMAREARMTATRSCGETSSPRSQSFVPSTIRHYDRHYKQHHTATISTVVVRIIRIIATARTATARGVHRACSPSRRDGGPSP